MTCALVMVRHDMRWEWCVTLELSGHALCEWCVMTRASGMVRHTRAIRTRALGMLRHTGAIMICAGNGAS